MIDAGSAVEMLAAWARAAEKHWYPMPGREGQGCYGTGFNTWGAQTNQKYLSAMAFLAARGPEALRDFAAGRALAALRYELATHVTGPQRRTDNSQWGHTWISSLGVERMMFGVYLIEDLLSAADREALDRMLASEADWLTDAYPVQACLFNAHGPNKPESNLWNGAVCWRAAQHNPDHPKLAWWREKARSFLINSVSVPEDIGAVARNVGAANFFSNYALDHHAYLNVGYMVICLSNAAMLHFDMRSRGWPTPPELMHHQRDLWQLVRRCIFANGRLCRIGGDTRIRYAYCQDYLLPSLLFAADAMGEDHAAELLAGQMQFIRAEFDDNGDGSFYGRRLAHLPAVNPIYYPRLESDRAGVVAMALRYAEIMAEGKTAPAAKADPAESLAAFERSVAGGWSEPHYGAAMHRSPSRIASFTWHSKYYDNPVGMGLCTPPDDGHLAEWSRNLIGLVQPCNFPYKNPMPANVPSAVGQHATSCFEGGFVTCGEILEGSEVELCEGFRDTKLLTQRLAFAALPDDHTVVGLQYVRPARQRTYIRRWLGMNLVIPNDLFNGRVRTVKTASATLRFDWAAGQDELVDLGERWFNVDGRVGAIGLYGAERMCLLRTRGHGDDKLGSLHVERFGWSGGIETFALDAGASLFDIGWMALSGLDAEATGRLAAANASTAIEGLPEEVRGASVVGADGRRYLVIANFSDANLSWTAPEGMQRLDADEKADIPPLSAAVFAQRN